MSEPIGRRAEAAALRLDVHARCLRRQPIREIAEELGVTPGYVAQLRNEILDEASATEIKAGDRRLLLQLEIEAARDDLRRLTARQDAHPAHGYDLIHAKLAVQARLLRLQGIDVDKVGAVVQINVNAPGAALAMQATPSEDLLRLLSEAEIPVQGEAAIEAGEGPEPDDDSGPVDV